MTQTDAATDPAVVEIGAYGHALRDRWWAVVLVVAVCVGVAVAVTMAATPRYRSTIKLVATETTAAEGRRSVAPVTPVQRVKSYEELVVGPRVATAVIDELDLDLPVEAVVRRIRATAVPDTVVLVVTVDDSDPVRAQAIATAIGEEFPQLVASFESPVLGARGVDPLTVFEPAVLPARPVWPDPIVNIGLGIAVAALLNGAILGFRARRYAT